MHLIECNVPEKQHCCFPGDDSTKSNLCKAPWRANQLPFTELMAIKSFVPVIMDFNFFPTLNTIDS